MLDIFIQSRDKFEGHLGKYAYSLINNMLAVGASEYNKLIEPDKSYKQGHLE
jgi:hypothetical protein